MKVDVDALFGSIAKMQGGAAAFAKKTGTRPDNLSHVKVGDRGLSLPASKAICKEMGGNPLNLYLASQVRALKMRDAGPSRTLTAIASIIKTLETPDAKRHITKESIGELEGYVAELRQIADEATTPEIGAEKVTAKRDGMGMVKKSRGDERTEEPTPTTARARNVDGTSRKKLM